MRFYQTVMYSCLLFAFVLLVYPSSLPVTHLSDSEMDTVVALSCGQLPGSTGLDNCTLEKGCETEDWHPISKRCRDNGATCGSCTGVLNIECQGPNTGSNDLCNTVSEPCCSLGSSCITEQTGAQYYECFCKPSESGPASPEGYHTTTEILSGLCPPGGGGGS